MGDVMSVYENLEISNCCCTCAYLCESSPHCFCMITNEDVSLDTPKCDDYEVML